MIFIDDVKYSCIECIRGHRSSLCKHHARPLLQVRSKGRPNVYVNGNPNHRIVVFVEEMQSTSKNNLIVGKTSPKQVMDIISGKILGPYIETLVENLRPPQPVIHSNSFINTLGCGCGISKIQKSCGCCNKTKKPNKSKILSTYLSKKLKTDAKLKQNNFQDIKSEDLNDTFSTDQPNNQYNDKNQHNNQHNNQLNNQNNHQANGIPNNPSNGQNQSNFPNNFSYITNPTDLATQIPIEYPFNCTMENSCVCDANCSCAGCKVHGNNINDFQLNYQQTELSISSLDLQNDIHQPTPNQMLTFSANPNLNQAALGDSALFQSTIPQANPVNGIPTHLSSRESYSSEIQSTPCNNSPSNDSLTNDSPSNRCSCPDNNCDCTNCETHGIINGFKLDDFFTLNNDPKLWTVLADFPELMTELNVMQNIPNEMVQKTSNGSCCSSTPAESKVNTNQFSSNILTQQPQSSSTGSCCSKNQQQYYVPANNLPSHFANGIPNGQLEHTVGHQSLNSQPGQKSTCCSKTTVKIEEN